MKDEDVKDEDEKYENFIDEEPVFGSEMALHASGDYVERLYENMAPYSYVWEYLRNSFQAGATKVRIQPDPVSLDTNIKLGLPLAWRWSIWDNGCGVPRKQALVLLKDLAATGKKLGRHDSFGIGAKISAFPWNRLGVTYCSSTSPDDEGFIIKAVQKPSGNRNFSIHRWEEDGKLVEVGTAPPGYRQDWQQPSGTTVVFSGNRLTEDTYFGPEGKGGLFINLWTVNKRFFRIPAGVEVKVWHTDKQDRSTWPTKFRDSDFRNAYGSAWYLDKYSQERGSFEAEGVKFHWWYHPKFDTTKSGIDSYVLPPGFVATLYDNEIYNGLYKETTKRGFQYNAELSARYRAFSLPFEDVWQHVTIIVEPPRFSDLRPDGVKPDATRSFLTSGKTGSDLPWRTWGRLFGANLPKTLSDLIEQMSDSLNASLDLTSIRQFFSSFDAMVAIKESKSSGPKPPNSGRQKGKRQKPKPHPLDPDKKGKRRSKYDEPGVEWVEPSALDSHHDPFEGKGAYYDEGRNIIVINNRWTLFKNRRLFWSSEYEGVRGARSVIERTIKEVYSQSLIARIVHMRVTYKGSSGWDDDAFLAALSPTALSFALVGLYDQHAQISKLLSGRLKVARKAEDSEAA